MPLQSPHQDNNEDSIMGYSHYWDSSKMDEKEFNYSALSSIQYLLVKAFKAGEIAFEADMPACAPLVCEDAIRFNGIGEDGHETFYLDIGSHSFCKTNQKSYDKYVVAVLSIIAYYHPDFTWSSDGDADDLEEGRAIAEKFCKYAKK